jgi:hypothetical protein
MCRKRLVGGTSGTGIYIGDDLETDRYESQVKRKIGLKTLFIKGSK